MKALIVKLKLAWKVISGKDFLLITRNKDRWEVANTFPDNQISRSGKAIYMI